MFSTDEDLEIFCGQIHVHQDGGDRKFHSKEKFRCCVCDHFNAWTSKTEWSRTLVEYDLEHVGLQFHLMVNKYHSHYTYIKASNVLCTPKSDIQDNVLKM